MRVSRASMVAAMSMVFGCADPRPEGAERPPVAAASEAARAPDSSLPGASVPSDLDLGALVRRARLGLRLEEDALVGGTSSFDVRIDRDRLEVRAFATGDDPDRAHTGTLSLRTHSIGGVATDPAAGAFARDEATLTVARAPRADGVIEELETTDDGVEQRWVLPSRPAGHDLVIEVEVSGLELVGSTPSGLHFGNDATGLGLRYGHATLIDAAGARTAVEAQWREDRIALVVSAAALDAAAYPAVLDPIIGPEVAVDVPVGSLESGSPAIACITDCLLAWTSSRGFVSAVYTTRIVGGVPTDPLGVRLAGAVGAAVGPLPSIATDGTRYLVGWQQFVSATAQQDVFVARVAADGTHLDPGGRNLTSTAVSEGPPVIASNGTSFLAAWVRDPASTSRAVYSARVASDGTVLDPGGVLVSNTPPSGRLASASDGSGYLVAWSNGVELRATRVSGGGLDLDAADLTLSSAGANCFNPTATYATDYFVAWQEASTTTMASDIAGTRVSSAGVVLDPGSIRITRARDQLEPFATSDGTRYFVAFADVLPSTLRDVLGVRISTAGAIVDAPPIAVSTGTGATPTAIARAAGNFMVVWRGTGPTGIGLHLTRVTASTGTVVDASGLPLTQRTNAESAPAVAWNGTDYLAAWVDDRAIEPGVYATRLAPDGTPRGPSATLVSPGGFSESLVRAEAAGSTFLVAWSDTRTGTQQAFAARVSSAGALLDPLGTRLAVGAGTQGVADIASDGSTWLVVWEDRRAGQSDVYAARVSSAGAALDGTGVAISAGTWTELTPGVAWNGASYLVAWYANQSVADPNIYGRRLRADATPLGLTFAIATPPGSQFVDAVASDGAGWLVLGHENTTPQPHFVVAVAADESVTAPVFVNAGGSAGALAWLGTRYVATWMESPSTTQAFLRGARIRSDGSIVDTTAFPLSVEDTRTALGATRGELAGGPVGRGLLVYGRDVGPSRVFSRTVTVGDPNGASCTEVADCASGFCVDGRCCDGACGGGATNDCMACSVVAGASVDGACGALSAAVASTVTCRPSSGTCDVAEVCSPSAAACPAEVVLASGTVCRPSGGACDVADVCDGTSAACPADARVPTGTACRASGGACDLAEACDGASPVCPTDARASIGTPCRTAAGVCDVAEACDGTSPLCPPDGFATSGTECRSAAGDCDVAERCDGAGASCPLDARALAGTECRATAGVCDAEETCDGTSTACPADAFASGGVCRPASDLCDVAESCSGSGSSCPADAFASGGVCRPASDVCDVAEACAGDSAACPADALAPAGTTCGAPSCAGTTETAVALCSGTLASCPAGSTRDCAPYVCGAVACLPGCATDTDCAIGFACVGSACVVPGLDAGSPDAGPPALDAGPPDLDAGTTDADASVEPDAGVPLDVGVLPIDSAMALDAGARDAASRLDAGALDAGAPITASPGCGCAVPTHPEGGARALGLFALALVLVRARPVGGARGTRAKGRR